MKIHGSSSARNAKKSMTFKVETNTSSSDTEDSSGSRRRLSQTGDVQPDDTASSPSAPKHHSGRHSGNSSDPQPRHSSKAGRNGNSASNNLQSVVAFLGMPADTKWTLYADGEIDRTVGMRDVLTYAAGRQMGRWAPRTEWCEVFVVEVRYARINQDLDANPRPDQPHLS